MNLKPVIVAAMVAVLFIAGSFFLSQRIFSLDDLTDHKGIRFAEADITLSSKPREGAITFKEEQLQEKPSEVQVLNEGIESAETDSSDSSDESTFLHDGDLPNISDAYPPVPPGFPIRPIWLSSHADNYDDEQYRQLVLMAKVLIKLWNQGDHNFVSSAFEGNKVYPLYPNTLYVSWREVRLPDGTTHRYISSMLGTGDVKLSREQRRAGHVPPGVRLIDLETGGINPYTFLNE